MDRRDFLTAVAAAGAASLTGCGSAPVPLPPGDLLGASLDLGHRLRARNFAPPGETRQVPVLIVGAGIGGLAAGWKLAQSGFADFLIVELESEAGGNSRAGSNAVSAYPWGAHYLPLPTREATAVRELLAELGVLQGDPRAVQPVYDERYLCATPQERLYRHGRWQEGLMPQTGVSAAERNQYQQFSELMEDFRIRRDGLGRRAFALPMALSSRAPELLALDRISMRDWLLTQGFDSPHLHWYVNYACRDDYGTGSAAVSAWAGIHYFACRDGEAQNAGSETVLTAPAGNAWLVAGMLRSIQARVGERLLTDALVFHVATAARGRPIAVDLFLPGEDRTLRLLVEQLIWAAPLFLVPQVFAGQPALHAAARSYSYAPWLVANLTLSRFPDDRVGAAPAWDNVLYGGASLGYVVATHQQMRLRPGATVFTCYRAFDDMSPQRGREALRDTPREIWAEQILAELEQPHPDIRQLTTRLDIFRNGHAMARPLPGLITGAARQQFAIDGERLRFAHADVSGFSLFEEAQYRGVLAAERTLRRLGVRFRSSLG
ncbi:NAD(P)-binding protein [Accumulibacter sp.]|uniref:NAD(P)-binding protein n=2 Tax=Accumulibacter sp. TaxID=2053492 RepID=UPI002589B2B1|nr:NAD(P)-binding protein [Accumulibacter sp.]HNO13715.1 NAD(P)-binding protein [Accumulibacter sp.]